MGASASVLVVSSALDTSDPFVPLSKVKRVHRFADPVSALLDDLSFDVVLPGDAADALPVRCLAALQLSLLPTPFVDAEFDRTKSLLPSFTSLPISNSTLSWFSVTSVPLFPCHHQLNDGRHQQKRHQSLLRVRTPWE